MGTIFVNLLRSSMSHHFTKKKVKDRSMSPKQHLCMIRHLPRIATQNLLKANKIDFLGNNERPAGSSPDLNPCGNLGVILEQRIEKTSKTQIKMSSEVLKDEPRKIELDTELFSSVVVPLFSYNCYRILKD